MIRILNNLRKTALEAIMSDTIFAAHYITVKTDKVDIRLSTHKLLDDDIHQEHMDCIIIERTPPTLQPNITKVFVYYKNTFAASFIFWNEYKFTSKEFKMIESLTFDLLETCKKIHDTRSNLENISSKMVMEI